MKKFIDTRLRDANFSTPSEYIRSLIRFDQERSARGEIEAFLRGALRGTAHPALDEEDWSAIENLLRERVNAKRNIDSNGSPGRNFKES